MDPIFSAGFNMPQAAPKSGGGMFGNADWKSALMAAIAGGMGRSNPQVAQAMMGMLQMKQRQAMEAQQYQRERGDRNADWQSHYDYEAAHPKPVNNDTSADYDFWQQHLSPEEFATWKQNKINPPRYQFIEGVGLVQVPGGGAPQSAAPPQAPVGKLRPLGAGGPSPSGSGGFL